MMYKYTNDMLPSVMHEYTRKTMKFIPTSMALAIKIYSELIEVKKG